MKIDDKTSHNSPSLRFPEFTGEWEKCKVSDLLDFYPTNSLSWDKLEYGTNAIQNLHYGLIHVGLPTMVDLSKDKLPNVVNGNTPKNYELCQEGDVAFADASEDTNEVAKAVEFYNLNGNKAICGLHTIHGRDNHQRTIVGYKGYAFSSISFHHQIRRIAQGTKIYSINCKNFSECYVGIPSKEEQSKIATLLRLIDERIAVQNKVIEKYESLIKALRHHLFSTLESVKEVPVADLLSYEQPTKYIVSDTEYSNNTDLTPVLTANKAFILGYTDEVEGIYDKGPCIILDDFTLDFKIVEFPFKVKSSAIKILSAKTTVSLRYIFEYLKFLDLNTEEHKRHYIAEIEPMSIELPEEDTIKSIAFLFDLMDKRRKGLERDQQLLKSQKDYLLREIFI